MIAKIGQITPAGFILMGHAAFFLVLDLCAAWRNHGRSHFGRALITDEHLTALIAAWVAWLIWIDPAQMNESVRRMVVGMLMLLDASLIIRAFHAASRQTQD